MGKNREEKWGRRTQGNKSSAAKVVMRVMESKTYRRHFKKSSTSSRRRSPRLPHKSRTSPTAEIGKPLRCYELLRLRSQWRRSARKWYCTNNVGACTCRSPRPRSKSFLRNLKRRKRKK